MPIPQRFWALLTLAVGVFLTGLDSSIANVALPTISQRLHVSAVDAIWIANAYQLGLIIFLLPASALGEIIGYRRLFLIGLTVFTVASAGCALAPSWATLIWARMPQGVGSAGAVGVANAMLRYIFPRKMLGQGYGIYAMIAASSSAIGPSVATAILSTFDWRWLFGISVPFGLAVIAAGGLTLPTSPRRSQAFDFSGALLNVCMLGLLLLGLDGISHKASTVSIAAELGSAVLAGLFLVGAELRQKYPMLPLDLLRIPLFRLSIMISVAIYSAQFLAYISLPFYFREMLGLSQAVTGVLMTPWPLVLVLSAPLTGSLADRYSVGLLCGLGLLFTGAGLVSLAHLSGHPQMTHILWRMILCGVGWGLVVAPNSRALMVSAPASRAGAASGMTAAA
jgi:MFS transporter, DHA2 family, multidrug resistance protein